MEKFVLDSPALEEAVKLRSTANYPPRRPGRSSLKEVQATGGGGAEYNGYFTLKDVSTYNEDGTIKEFRIAVCDGETWDPETETSGKSVATCNGYKYSFQSVIIPIEKSSEIFIVCGRNQDYYNGIVSYMQDDELNSKLNVTGYSFYHIGSVVVTEEGSERSIEVIQRHTTESAYIPFDQFCGDFEASAKSNGDGTFDKVSLTFKSGYVSINGTYRYVSSATIESKANTYALIRYNYKTDVIDIFNTPLGTSNGNIIDAGENTEDSEGNENNGDGSEKIAFSIIGEFDKQGNWYHRTGNNPHSIWIFDTVCKELTE